MVAEAVESRSYVAPSLDALISAIADPATADPQQQPVSWDSAPVIFPYRSAWDAVDAAQRSDNPSAEAGENSWLALVERIATALSFAPFALGTTRSIGVPSLAISGIAKNAAHTPMPVAPPPPAIGDAVANSRQRYSEELRARAVAATNPQGVCNLKICDELGVHPESLKRWRRQDGAPKKAAGRKRMFSDDEWAALCADGKIRGDDVVAAEEGIHPGSLVNKRGQLKRKAERDCKKTE